MGLLYAAGAVSFAGQMRDAGLPTSEVLPLVPLEQILGRGIATLLAPIALIVLYVLLAGVSVRTSSGKPTRTYTIQVGSRRFAILALGVVLVTLVMPLDLLIVVGGSLAFAGLLTFLAWPVLESRLSNWTLAAAWTGFIIVSSIASVPLQAYFDPRPLSEICVKLADDTEQTGDLVLRTSSTVFLREQPDHITAISNGRIASTDISISEPTTSQSVAARAFDLVGW